MAALHSAPQHNPSLLLLASPSPSPLSFFNENRFLFSFFAAMLCASRATAAGGGCAKGSVPTVGTPVQGYGIAQSSLEGEKGPVPWPGLEDTNLTDHPGYPWSFVKSQALLAGLPSLLLPSSIPFSMEIRGLGRRDVSINTFHQPPCKGGF